MHCGAKKFVCSAKKLAISLMLTCKELEIFFCFIENVQVSCASFATVLVKELGHPICEYFDDQGPF